MLLFTTEARKARKTATEKDNKGLLFSVAVFRVLRVSVVNEMVASV
jgi:hypothetical protein